MSENIDKEFTLQYEVIENGWIKTSEGTIYTENDYTGESALEVYERVLREKENPPIPVPTLEEKVQLQEDKISNLNEIVNIQLMATDELYMMIEPLLETEVQTYTLGGSKMVEMYVAMIQRGLKTIDEVPVRYREQVKEILEELEK